MTEHIYESAVRKLIARQSPDSQQQLQQFSGQLFDTISHGLLQDGHVRIHQFGSFKLNWAKQRRGRHPKTGAPLIIPAQARISFTPAKALKDQVNQTGMAELGQPILPISMSSQLKSREQNTAISSSESPTDSIAKSIQSSTVIDDGMNKSKPRSPQSLTLNRKTALAASIIVALLVALLLRPTNEQISPQYSASQHESNSVPRMEFVAESAVIMADNQTPMTASQLASSEQSRETEVETNAQLIAATDTTEVMATHVIEHSAGQAEQIFFRQRPHKLVDGDSLWRLSRKNYNNPFYWPHIYQANRSSIKNPNKLETGTHIVLPSLLGTPDNLTSEDRRSIAEGYFLVYRYHKQTNRPFPYYALLGVNKFDPAVIQENISEIDEQDWHSLQLASN